MNLGGHKVLPAWIEDAVLAYDAITEAAAFAVPDMLFAKIDDARREELEARFAGQV